MFVSTDVSGGGSMTGSYRPSVLMVAYACDPTMGSEPGVGWAWMLAAARSTELTLVTAEENRHRLATALKDLKLDVRVEYVRAWPVDCFAQPAGRGQYAHYVCWLRAATHRCRALVRERKFDLAHHVTYAIDWLPSPLARVPSLNYIWGPVGGSTYPPVSLLRWLTTVEVAKELARLIASTLLRATVTRSTANRARLVLAINDDSGQSLRRAHRVEVRPNAALQEMPRDLLALRRARSKTSDAPKAIFLGRTVAWKGVGLALEAIARRPNWQLVVVGAGRLDRWRSLAQKLAVSERVQFLGELPRATALKILAQCDVLLHPSMHDSAPWSVAEAASLGLPVICLDRGGPPILAGELALTIRPTKDVPEQLAHALDTCRNHLKAALPDWSLERLEADLRRWYGVDKCQT